MKTQHRIIASSDNDIFELHIHEDFSMMWGKKVKVLKQAEFLEAIKTPRHAKTRPLGATIDHDAFLEVVKSKNLILWNIKYTVNGELFNFELLINHLTTPRSINWACLQDYKNKGIKDVVMPYYDDDNDIYRPSNTDVKIVFTPDFYSLDSLSGWSKREIEDAFL